MALQDLLNSNIKHDKIGISEERLQPIIPVLKQYIAFWREYPDLFVDFLQDGGDPTKEKQLKFFFYQFKCNIDTPTKCFDIGIECAMFPDDHFSARICLFIFKRIPLAEFKSFREVICSTEYYYCVEISAMLFF